MELQISFGSPSHILYVNGQYRGDSDIGRLMHDFCCNDPNEMYFSEMSDAARFFKKSPEGVKIMCESMEQLRAESEKIGEEKGKEKERLSMVTELIRDGILTVKDAALRLGISEQELQSKIMKV